MDPNMSELSNDIDDEDTLPMYGYIDKHKLKNNKPNMISIKLIMDRNLKKTERQQSGDTLPKITELNEADSLDEVATESKQTDLEDTVEMKANQLLRLTHVHLDRECIGEIDNLAEYLDDVTHLFLQHNLIERIENLEFLHK